MLHKNKFQICKAKQYIFLLVTTVACEYNF